MTIQSSSRRSFIQSLGAVAVSPAAFPLLGSLATMQEAVAATQSGYKALVCVYLAGGNDALNTVLPLGGTPDAGVYAELRADIVPNFSEFKVLNNAQNNAGQAMGLHPQLGYLADVYNGDYPSLKLAVVGNVGPLLKPTTRATQDTEWPLKVFSHNDQTSVWLTGKLEGNGQGWGASMAGLTGANTGSSGAAYQSVSMAFASPFSASENVTNFVANLDSGLARPIGINFSDPSVYNIMDTGYMSTDTLKAMVFSGTQPRIRGHVLEDAYNTQLANAYSDWEYLCNPASGTLHLDEPPLAAWSELKEQLRMVANFIKSQDDINVGRQVFYVQMGGFDTHTGQARVSGADSPHDKLMIALNDALQYFYDALGTENHAKVTTFTASEFGRKLLQNGDGTDHGWGGHHFVLGGAVNHGVFGSFPSVAQNPNALGKRFVDEQLLDDGTLVPEVSVEQFGWELAKWLGVPDTDTARKSIFSGYFPAGSGIDVSFMSNT